MGLQSLLRGELYVLYVDKFRFADQWRSSVGIVRLRTKGHENEVRSSQETRPWAFTACYGDSFTFIEKHSTPPPLSDTMYLATSTHS
jgi:hypothetical protein